MNIHIMGYTRTIQYTPKVPTLAIRVFDSYIDADNSVKHKLQNSPNFTELRYIFDDIDVDTILAHSPNENIQTLERYNVLFNPEFAKKILNDFEQHKNEHLDLLIHCTIGSSRSPAVAIALNDIFNLGQDSYNLKQEYPSYNRFVYRLLKEI